MQSGPITVQVYSPRICDSARDPRCHLFPQDVSLDMKSRKVYIDLFAGCGGLSVGLHNAGWRGLFAVEKNPDAFRTLQRNLIFNKNHFSWPTWLEQGPSDIDELLDQHSSRLNRLSGKVDLVAGGPPCQGFSTAGRRNRNDSRNHLVHSYLKFVEIVKPKAILLENVRGFTMPFCERSSSYSDMITESLINLGYSDVEGHILDAADFGVPQSRRRFLAIATRAGVAPSIFQSLLESRENFLRSKRLPARSSASSALSDLEMRNGSIEDIECRSFRLGLRGSATTGLQRYLRVGTRKQVPDSHRFVNHRPQTTSSFKTILRTAERNRSVSDTLRGELGITKRCITPLDPNRPSPTVTTIPDDLIHYSEPRVMTPRECARLQTFPDWFEFTGPYTTGGLRRRTQVPRYTQIGNAVPPLWAEQMGMAIRKFV